MNRIGDHIILNNYLTEHDELSGRYVGEEGIFVKRELCGDVVVLFNDDEYYYLNEEQFVWGENATIESIFKAFKRNEDKELMEAITQFMYDEMKDLAHKIRYKA